jgi:hypothetical protein
MSPNMILTTLSFLLHWSVDYYIGLDELMKGDPDVVGSGETIASMSRRAGKSMISSRSCWVSTTNCVLIQFQLQCTPTITSFLTTEYVS